MSKRRTAILIAVAAVVIAAVGVATWTGNTGPTNPLIEDLERDWEIAVGPERKVPDLAVNHADTVQKYIPIGTRVHTAKELLKNAGFSVSDGRAELVPPGRDQVVFGVLVSPRKRTPFSNHSFTIILEVSKGVVASVSGWGQHTAL